MLMFLSIQEKAIKKWSRNHKFCSQIQYKNLTIGHLTKSIPLNTGKEVPKSKSNIVICSISFPAARLVTRSVNSIFILFIKNSLVFGLSLHSCHKKENRRFKNMHDSSFVAPSPFKKSETNCTNTISEYHSSNHIQDHNIRADKWTIYSQNLIWA